MTRALREGENVASSVPTGLAEGLPWQGTSELVFLNCAFYARLIGFSATLEANWRERVQGTKKVFRILRLNA